MLCMDILQVSPSLARRDRLPPSPLGAAVTFSSPGPLPTPEPPGSALSASSPARPGPMEPGHDRRQPPHLSPGAEGPRETTPPFPRLARRASDRPRPAPPQSLLTDPNPASPANPEAAQLYMTDRQAYDRRVVRFVSFRRLP